MDQGTWNKDKFEMSAPGLHRPVGGKGARIFVCRHQSGATLHASYCWGKSVSCAGFLHGSGCYWSAFHSLNQSEGRYIISADRFLFTYAVHNPKVSRGRSLKICVVFYLVSFSLGWRMGRIVKRGIGTVCTAEYYIQDIGDRLATSDATSGELVSGNFVIQYVYTDFYLHASTYYLRT